MVTFLNGALVLAFVSSVVATGIDPKCHWPYLILSTIAVVLIRIPQATLKTVARVVALGLAVYSVGVCLRWIPGMAPMESGVVEFLALALATDSTRDSRSNRPSRQMLFLFPSLVLLVLLWINGLYGGNLQVGMTETISMTALAAAILLNPPLQWPVNVLASPYPSQRLARVFLVCSTVVPILLGAGLLYTFEREIINLRTAMSVFVFLLVVLCGFIVLMGASWSQRINRARDQAIRRLEESWKSREAYFRNLVDNSAVILYLSGPDGACTFLSRKWQDYTGRSPIDDLGYKWLDCVHPEDRERMAERARMRAPIQMEPYSSEFRLRRWDGVYRWVFSNGFPRFDDQRRFIGYMGNVIDVHDRKIHEDSLKKEKQDAEISNQTKSQFLANMSHEIRTPLNAILGFADLCSETGCSPTSRGNYLKRIRWNGDHLLRLIDDILDLAKMESGAKLVQRTHFSIDKTIDEIVESLRALASQKGLFIKVIKGEKLPTTVHSDPYRIKQIVNNLVGNAIKFTQRGGVTVTVRRQDRQIFIDVADTGIGIRQEQVPNLFKPFSQGDGSVTRNFGGTGLGLHLSKKLAQSIGGDVTLKSSQPGQGSVFETYFDMGDVGSLAEVDLNRASAAKADARPVPETKLTGRKILVVEDSPDSRDLLQIYFQPTGAELFFAEDGYGAIEKAWRHRPDMILMDVQMPGLDGLEATRRLRADGFKNPIVALTAHALQDEVDRSFEAGCTFHLTKPVSRVTLLTLAGELLANSRQDQMQV